MGGWVGGVGVGVGGPWGWDGVPGGGVLGVGTHPGWYRDKALCKARSEHTKERIHSERASGSAGKRGAYRVHDSVINTTEFNDFVINKSKINDYVINNAKKR